MGLDFLVGWGDGVQAATQLVHPPAVRPAGELQAYDIWVDLSRKQQGGFKDRLVADQFEPVPAGKYLAAIVESEMKPTKSGNGHFLELTFEVGEGPYKGRKLWARLNLDNPNPQAVQIARGELSAICRAVSFAAPA